MGGERPTIYIIRHGQTELNSAHALQGRSNFPLNKAGREQAEEAGRKLRALGIRFSRVFSSLPVRAIQTAEPVQTEFAKMEAGSDTYVSLRNSISAVKKGNYVFRYNASMLIVTAMITWRSPPEAARTNKTLADPVIDVTFQYYYMGLIHTESSAFFKSF